MRGGLLVVLVWLLWGSAAAQAQDGVLLRERDALRPGLCGALRIQLSGLAEVHCEAEPGAEPLAGRIDQTTARVHAQDARLGVLLERDPDPGLLRMYIVSARPGQALVAMERIEDRPEPDIDRSLALKVASAYAMVGLARTAAPQNELPLAAGLAEPRAESPANWLLFLDVGGGVHLSEAGTRGLANLALGVARSRGRARGELALGARFDSQAHAENSAGTVYLRERGGVASARALWAGGRFELGGALEALFSAVSAEGITKKDGSRAEQTLFVASLGVAGELRLRLFGSAFLRFAPLLELAPHAPQFAVDHSVVLRSGVVRGTLPLSLLVRLPLRADAASTREVQP